MAHILFKLVSGGQGRRKAEPSEHKGKFGLNVLRQEEALQLFKNPNPLHAEFRENQLLHTFVEAKGLEEEEEENEDVGCFEAGVLHER